MDRRLLIGIAILIVIGIGLYGFTAMQPQPPDDGDGDNGPEPPVPSIAIITGSVTDSKTGDPVASVTITIDGETVSTDNDGKYEITVDVGSYVVSIDKEGYDPDSSTVDASEEETYSIDFVISPIELPPVREKILRIITRHGSDIYSNGREEFWKTGIPQQYGLTDKKQIRFLPVSSNLWVDTIRNSANNNQNVDIAWGGGPVLFNIVANEGLLAPLKDEDLLEVLDDIPDEISGVPAKLIIDNDVYWTGSAISSFGFTLNTNYLEQEGLPEPTSWKDLANETYAVTLPNPSIGTADATLSTSNTRMFEIILQTYGWEEGWKLLTLKGANARIYDRSESVRDAAIQGTIGAGTTIDFYGYTAQLENPDFCKYVLPSDGTIVNADPIALLSTSMNSDLAQEFIKYIVSVEGQKIWLNPKINRMPMNPAVFDTPEGLERGDLREIFELTQEALIISFSDDVALSYTSSMMFFYHATLVRPQFKLQDTWIELTYAEEIGDITHRQFLELADDLSNPLEFEFLDPETGEPVYFTEEYAMSINNKMATDATFKQQMQDTWIIAAEARYDAIMEQLNELTS